MRLLEIKNLSKSFRSHWTYRSRPALHKVSLHLERGDILGVVGHNGAGKTTTIKCILGLLSQDAGEINFNGKPLTSAKQRAEIGYLPELPYFYENLTVEQTLTLYGELCDLRGSQLRARIDQLLTQFELLDRRRSRMASLSKGLKQRVGFAQAIINNPGLLILDEPFSGLDPMARHEFKEIIKELRDQGTSILLSSHVLSDVEELCNRVTVLSAGEVRKEIDIAELHQLGRRGYELTVGVSELNDRQMVALNPDSVENFPGRVVLNYVDEAAAQAALKISCSLGLSIIKFTSKAPTLEELFVELNTTNEKDTNDSALHLS